MSCISILISLKLSFNPLTPVPAVTGRDEQIWPRSSLKTTKMSKNAFLAKSSWSEWVDYL